ncbi:MAG: type II toxin-antitoxin system RelE/ParE family toxin [Fibrobacter sp.]|uniref:type II toxin-antitoxin system RelE/ParE family toxin n=1 Tax=Fibrobacter sp. TaxID=35828 RepID=UPI0025C0CC40|nr:type II toxin-antitoxin system RelE/ParE family toxin [Fibrobacter sp.]MBR4785301.1 type II toxin-antitoxin system RelE/ParE family toxin [Fibrobacter sp.]
MEYKVFVTERAKSDLAEVYSYISTELQSIATANNVIDSLQRAMKDLSIMPNRYHRYMEEPWLSEGVRYFSVRNFSVFYTVDDDEQSVFVVHVIYSKRDFPQILPKI